MDQRDASILRRPTGVALIALVMATLVGVESGLHRAYPHATFPLLHLGVAAGLVIWGRWRMVWPICLGTAIGILGSLAPGLIEGRPPAHALGLLILEPAVEAAGLSLLLTSLGRARLRIAGGRVELPDAMRLVGVAMPLAILPVVGLHLLLVRVGSPSDVSVVTGPIAGQVAIACFSGILAGTPIVVSMLPTRSAAQTYRCHCRYPLLPMAGMSLLVPIGLILLIENTNPASLLAISSVLAVGVLGGLALASGWMATGFGMLLLTVVTTGTSLASTRSAELTPGIELMSLTPAFMIAVLFASTMESRFRDRLRLSDRHDEIRTLVEATGAAILRVATDGRVVYANDAARRLGSTPDTGGTRTISEWFGPENAAAVQALVANLLMSGDRQAEFLLARDGGVIPHLCVCTPLRDERQHARGFTLAIMDLHDRHLREQARRRRSREELRSLATAHVHDVNSLAMAVGGVASLARESSHDTSVGRVLEDIERSCEQAARRVSRVKHLTSTPGARWRPIDPGDAIRRRLEDRRRTGTMTVASLLQHETHPVAIDPDLAAFIVDEFVSNAEDAVLGEVASIHAEIRDDLDARRVVVVLRDDGPGIPPSILPRLGSTFVSTKGGGRGLGLRAIQRGVRLAGGTATISSSDRGTTLRISLPWADTPDDAGRLDPDDSQMPTLAG